MQKNTDRRKAPIVCAAVFVVLLAVILAAIVVPLLSDSYGIAAVRIFLLAYAAILIAVMIGILLALRQRLREIASGEEEEAKKY